MDSLTQPAPDGQLYVCSACGKASKTKSGFDSSWKVRVSNRGWDESCMLNAVLCYEDKGPDGTWDAVKPGDPKNWPMPEEKEATK